jgi:hypothetical protein
MGQTPIELDQSLALPSSTRPSPLVDSRAHVPCIDTETVPVYFLQIDDILTENKLHSNS